jgi:hypothetical protein
MVLDGSFKFLKSLIRSSLERHLCEAYLCTEVLLAEVSPNGDVDVGL